MALLVVACGALSWWCAARWRARRGDPGLATKLAFSALVTLTCGATVLLGFELYFRFGYDATDSFALLKTSQSWFARHYRTNSWHLRDDVEYAFEKTPGRRRIAFLGDSFTNGHGIADVENRFANRIRAAHPEWEVQVLALDGLDTGAELTLLERTFARGYRTDDVVLVYCLNDLGDLLPEWRRVVDALYAEQRDASFLVRDSYAVNQIYFQLRRMRSPELAGYYPLLAAAYRGPVWDRQAARLERMVDLVRAHGARFLAVTFPFVHALGPDYPFREAHERLAALWQRLDVPYLDLLPDMAGRPASALVVNRNDAHPSRLAHAVAARAIARFLETEALAAPSRGGEHAGPLPAALPAPHG